MPFLAALAVVAASYGAGMTVTAGGRLAGGADLRGRSTAFALGFASLSALALLAGVLGGFTRPVLGALAIGFAVVGAAALVRDLRRARSRTELANGRLLLATAAVVAVDVVLASAPPTSGDATAYHLTAPKLWLGAGRVFTIWWDWATFQPFALEMQGGYAMALAGGRAAMVVAALLSGATVVPVYGLAREVAGRRAGAVAALLWVGQGMFLWEATGAFVEAVGGGLVALAAWQLVCFARSHGLREAALAGAVLGVAASTKYHALLFLPAFAVAAAALDRRRALRAAGALLLAAAVGLPWYVKNLVVTGNPLYPLASGIFGGRLWNAADAAWWPQSYAGYGPTAAWKAPLFPLMFLLEPGRYERGYSLSLAVLAFAPVGAVVGGRWARAVGLALVLYLVVWSVSMHQITRYLVLVLPLASVLAALGILWSFRAGRLWRAAAGAVAATSALVLLAITGLFAYQVGPGVAGTQATGAYVQRLTGTYDALAWIDGRLPQSGRVLVLGARNLYWLEHPYVAFYPPLLAPGDSPGYVERQLHRYDVRWVASLAGVPPPWLERHLRPLGSVEVPIVSSRTLLRISGRTSMRLYAWCPGRGSPCRTAGA